MGLCLVAVVGNLDAAGLSASPDLHLRLHDDGVAELLGGLAGLLRGHGNTAFGHGDAVLGEQLLALVLEQVHVSFRPPAAGAAAPGSYQQTP
jgi:hypothetical protein